MCKPNFFILGAPKCGTTSLAAWLAEHPNIFMSAAKEPHFFNTDDKRIVNTLEQYERYFRDARSEHIAVGEASVWYLSSIDAVPNIRKYNPDARFIVMLRNPLEMATALHAEMLFTRIETEPDFATAWNLQEDRRHGRRLPPLCWEPRWLRYGDLCSLGAQLERLRALVPGDRILTILLDDIRKDARREYLRVLDFLSVSDDQRADFAVHNPAKVRRWPGLLLLSSAVLEIKRMLGITGGLGIWTKIDEKNRIETHREPLSPAMSATLKGYFAADIQRLGRLLGRDLNGWLA